MINLICIFNEWRKNVKRRLIVMLVILIGIAALFPVSAENSSRPVLTAEVQEDGSVMIQCFLQETEYDTVNIYKQGETVTEGGEHNPLPLIWWVAWHGRFVTYPGINQYPIYFTNRASELSNGAGSALLPGRYYAILLGKNSAHLTEPVEFEILGNSSPSETLPTQSPVALPTAVPTETPVLKTAAATATGTSAPEASLTAGPSSLHDTATAAAGTLKESAASSGRPPATATVETAFPSETKGRQALWIGIGAAAAILIAAVIAIVVKRQKT